MRKPILIWPLTGRGFASELNLMVLARLYAYYRGYGFALSSHRWNMAIDKGWEDYFEPYCYSISGPELDMSYVFVPPTIRVRIERFRKRALLALRLRRPVYLDHNVWDKIWNEDFVSLSFKLPDGEASVDCVSACRRIVESIWRLNPETACAVSALVSSLPDLSNPYFVLQVRRGDKVSEAPSLAIRTYMERVAEVNRKAVRRCLVMTDDYECVRELREQYSDFQFFTLCSETEQGHSQNEFNHRPPLERQRAARRLIAELTLSQSADFFVGTFSSNLARLVALLRKDDRCYGADFPFRMIF